MSYAMTRRRLLLVTGMLLLACVVLFQRIQHPTLLLEKMFVHRDRVELNVAEEHNVPAVEMGKDEGNIPEHNSERIITEKLVTPFAKKEENFKTLLRQTADSNGLIYLSSIDSAYLDMALNLYTTSFRRLNITNYLFVCSDEKADDTLRRSGINSVTYLVDKSSDKVAIFGTKDFNRKTHLKTKIILDALHIGLTVIIVDVDIIFFTDPLPYLDCAYCDIQIQNDFVEANSGFYMARPSAPSIDLHQKAWDMAAITGESLSNQKLLNRTMEAMQRRDEIKVKTLDSNLFPCGFVYFEEKVRMFYTDNPPSQEVILHNNWIVSMEAKRYRFKELLWWHVDRGYYSDSSRKYLAYENPKDFGLQYSQRNETDALISALIIGQLLHRTVILPTFTCHNCKYGACKIASRKCTFNTHYHIASFDAVMGENYREHVFLEHPLVPSSVKAPSACYLIHPSLGSVDVPAEVTVLTPADLDKGPTAQEVLKWFSTKTEPVLRFHSLYDVLGTLRREDVFNMIKKEINERTDYRQY